MKLDHADDLTPDENPQVATADQLADRIQVVAESALESGKPLEVSPTREQLFDIFAEAYAADLTGDEGDLSADELTRLLGHRWGLDQSAKSSVAQQEKMSDNDLAKMRLLWSTLRLWMEWDYAWSRWAEFNDSVGPNRPR